ncbi:MAG: hypothetical protein U1F60_13765 [Planctomycetota bacterium]
MEWDRTRSWLLKVHEVERARVHLHFDAPITLRDMAAIRRVLPEFAHAKPAEIRDRISDSGDLEVGEYSNLEANGVMSRAREAGLPAVRTSTSYTTRSIIEQGEPPMYLLIEDDEEHARVVQEMRSAGVEVRYLTSD